MAQLPVRNFVKQTKLTQAIINLLVRKFVQYDEFYASKRAVKDLCGVAFIMAIPLVFYVNQNTLRRIEKEWEKPKRLPTHESFFASIISWIQDAF